MCGIIGFLGFDECYPFIINGLKQLQNRGYDSAGICTLNNDSIFKITKFASKDNETAIEKIDKHRDNHSKAQLGIGHTRWATHGEKTDINSHPHTDMYNRFSLVHNGIIENYAYLKKFLESKGFIFKSQTDTEVIVNLISFHYLEEKEPINSILKALSKLQGTYALCIIFNENPNTLYCIRKGSPLIVSANENFAIISSENSGFCGMVKSYICLDNHDLCILQKVENKITIKTNKHYPKNELKNYVNSLTPEPYPYWTLKEIMEQPDSINRSISLGGRIFNDNSVKLGGLQQLYEELKDVNNIILLGCGTSLYAGFIGAYIFKELCNFNTVSVLDGSEFHLRDLPKQGKTGLIFLSQSGETKDLFNALEISKEANLISIGVINVVDSYIAKNVDCGVYLNAGREVAVASTKSFSSQVVILTLIGLWFAQQKNIHITLRNNIIKNLRNLSNDIKTVLEDNIDKIQEIAKYLFNWESVFLLGKGINEFYCRESSLKLKEIGYIHAEAYNSSALKHGPYSLLVENQPVIIMINKDEYLEKNQGIIEEIKSRKGFIIAISEIVPEKYDIHVQIPNNKFFRGLLCNIVLQMVAYELALLKGHNPDMPRNLAKVVTVD